MPTLDWVVSPTATDSTMHDQAPSVAQLFRDRVAATPAAEAFRFPDTGSWRSVTWQQVGDRVRLIAAGLIALGVAPEDRVALASSTRYEWVLADFSVLCAGAATCAEVDAAARRVIEDGGFGPEFRHRLGHGIGMDVHEAPFLTKTDHTPVQEGMMFTIEPSIIQFESFSSRVEDVVVARPGGGEPLTTSFQSLIVVE